MRYRYVATVAVALLLAVGVAPAAPADTSTEPVSSETPEVARDLDVADVVFTESVEAVEPTSVLDEDDPTVIVTPETDVVGPADPADSIAVAGGKTSCRKITGTITGQNYWGQRLWSFTQWMSWCYNGSKIVSKDSGHNVWCCYAGWDYQGVIANYGDSTLYPQRFTRTRQAKFSHCSHTPWGSPCSYKTPWVQQQITATGAYTNRGGTGSPPK